MLDKWNVPGYSSKHKESDSYTVQIPPLLKEWKILIQSLDGIEPFCYPTETDGLFNHRVAIFKKAGFSSPDIDGKMVFNLKRV